MDWRERERLQLIEKFNEATVTDGIVRWNSNGQVPPADVLEVWFRAGLPFDLSKSTTARALDVATFIAEYRRRNGGPVSAEQRAEMRAAFGPGVEVVNVITGRRTRT